MAITYLGFLTLTVAFGSVAQSQGTGQQHTGSSKQASQNSIVIEVIREPDKPAKVLLLRPPVPKDPELQQPSWQLIPPAAPDAVSHPDPSAIGLSATQVGDSAPQPASQPPDSGRLASPDEALKLLTDRAHRLQAQFQVDAEASSKLAEELKGEEQALLKFSIRTLGEQIQKLVQTLEAGKAPEVLPTSLHDFVQVLKDTAKVEKDAFSFYGSMANAQEDQAANDLRAQQLDDQSKKINAAMRALHDVEEAVRNPAPIQLKMLPDGSQNDGATPTLTQGMYHSDDGGVTWKLNASSDFSIVTNVLLDPPAGVIDEVLPAPSQPTAETPVNQGVGDAKPEDSATAEATTTVDATPPGQPENPAEPPMKESRGAKFWRALGRVADALGQASQQYLDALNQAAQQYMQMRMAAPPVPQTAPATPTQSFSQPSTSQPSGSGFSFYQKCLEYIQYNNSHLPHGVPPTSTAQCDALRGK
ncbi:MAG TPA: hypothetical protein VJX67_04265 [Blastocatellia bacterium]|nr:hypothetical protein [Blastocatellia bacterium]